MRSGARYHTPRSNCRLAPAAHCSPLLAHATPLILAWQVGGNNPIPGRPPAIPNLPEGAKDDLVVLDGGKRRPSALDIWLTPHHYPGIQLFQSEADEILNMFKEPRDGGDGPKLFGPDSQMAREAAGFEDGPAIMINTMRKVREFPVEAEGDASHTPLPTPHFPHPISYT